MKGNKIIKGADIGFFVCLCFNPPQLTINIGAQLPFHYRLNYQHHYQHHHHHYQHHHHHDQQHHHQHQFIRESYGTPLTWRPSRLSH